MNVPPVNAKDLESFPLGQNPFGAKNPSLKEIQAFEKLMNGRDPKEFDFSQSQPGDMLRVLVEKGFQPPVLVRSVSSPSLSEALSKTVADFKSEFAEHAQSRAGFHALLSQAFGPIDANAAEDIRLDALDGDFSGVPKIELVSGDPTFRGAYSAEEETVFLNQSLLDDPADALRVFAEEVGHHLETEVRVSDSPGDEGAVFARTFLGEKLSPQALDALHRENYHAIVVLDRETTRVEFDDPPPVELPPVTTTADPIDFFDPGGIDINGIPFDGGGSNQPTITDVRFNGGEGIGKIHLRGVDLDILNVAGDGNEVVANGRRFKLTSNLIERISFYLSNNVVIDGIGFATEDDFAVTLDRVEGTHNDWVFHIFSTPYDALAQTTGLPWERYDQAYLDLKTRGFDDFAIRLQTDGILPPLGAFEPGSKIETAWRADYDGFLQRTADTQGIPIDVVTEAVNDLYAQDGINASKLLVGDLTVLNVDAVNQGNAQYANRDGFTFEWKASVENPGTDQAGVSLEQVFTQTPYDELVQTTGVPWERFEQGYQELIARGFEDLADRLQNDGVIPPLEAFEPGGEIQTSWRADYDTFQQSQGIPIDSNLSKLDTLELTGHNVFGIGPVHTAFKYTDKNGDIKTLSAGPAAGINGSNLGFLNGEVGRDGEADNFHIADITPPSGMSVAEYWDRLVEINNNYDDQLDYDLFPELIPGEGYNSNSFTFGLLEGTGGTLDADPADYDGGSTPIPLSNGTIIEE